MLRFFYGQSNLTNLIPKNSKNSSESDNSAVSRRKKARPKYPNRYGIRYFCV